MEGPVSWCKCRVAGLCHTVVRTEKCECRRVDWGVGYRGYGTGDGRWAAVNGKVTSAMRGQTPQPRHTRSAVTVVVMSLLIGVMAKCPNSCSQHGTCDQFSGCQCFPGDRGTDCSARTYRSHSRIGPRKSKQCRGTGDILRGCGCWAVSFVSAKYSRYADVAASRDHTNLLCTARPGRHMRQQHIVGIARKHSWHSTPIGGVLE